MVLHPDYKKWKAVMDNMYACGISKQKAVEKLLKILVNRNIKPRPENHALEVFSYFVYNKEEYSAQDEEKPLGLGIVYTKPNGQKTQDIFIAHPKNGLEQYHSEKKMVRKYPSMKGVHKKDLPIE